MEQTEFHKEFAFTNNKGELALSVDKLLLFLEERLVYCNNYTHLISRSKWIITELLTNAYKHSSSPVIHFKVEIGQSTLFIKKIDQDEPFSITIDNRRKYFPLDFEEDRHILHKDDFTILYATLCTEDTLMFTVKDDVDITGKTVYGMGEHFGLIIITRSSDEFTYTYDSGTKTNIFSSKLNLPTADMEQAGFLAG